MKRVLMVSPHFPPDSGAATHRLRLIAPRLPEFGWEPTVMSVDASAYEGRLEPDLLSLVPRNLDVVRVHAFSARWTRKLGFGDLGLRALPGLFRACRERSRSRDFDCFFVTIYPTYPALLGPLVKRWAQVPFVLDYQDPWVGEWGRSTGPGSGRTPDLKSRLSRAVAERLEPIAVRSADAITAVSELTFRSVQDRFPEARSKLCETIPIGGDAADFDYLRSHPRPNALFDATDGKFHLCYVGTILPLGMETLRSFLRAVARLKDVTPHLGARLRVHFVGTSNQSVGDLSELVIPEARLLGVAEIVHEVPARVHYLDALNVLTQAHAILLMGSSERHYTASKLYPALLAKRPLLALFHGESSVVSILRSAVAEPAARLVTYDDGEPASARIGEVCAALRSLMEQTTFDPSCFRPDAVDAFSARSMAGRLARLLDAVAARKTP